MCRGREPHVLEMRQAILPMRRSSAHTKRTPRSDSTCCSAASSSSVTAISPPDETSERGAFARATFDRTTREFLAATAQLSDDTRGTRWLTTLATRILSAVRRRHVLN